MSDNDVRGGGGRGRGGGEEEKEEGKGEEGGKEEKINRLGHSTRHFLKIFTLLVSFNPLKNSKRELLFLSHITYKKTKVWLNKVTQNLVTSSKKR